jgi:hypothetical protein
MSLAERVTEVLAEWEKSPGKVFEWRSKALKVSMLVLEEIIQNPSGQGRSKDLSRIRAIAQLQSLAVALESMRTDVPVVCPHCSGEFMLK